MHACQSTSSREGTSSIGLEESKARRTIHALSDAEDAAEASAIAADIALVTALGSPVAALILDAACSYTTKHKS
jgi:hypothetical protein